jgi:hypothetical protein
MRKKKKAPDIYLDDSNTLFPYFSVVVRASIYKDDEATHRWLTGYYH